MRYIIASALATVAIATPSLAVSHDAEAPTCYEDQVMAWQGSTKQHTVCVDVDDPAIRDAIANAARR